MNLVQTNFTGGMDLLSDDTKPQMKGYGASAYIDTYRIGFNMRCRYNALEQVLASKEDPAIPLGIKQAIITFGDYIIVFIAGYAYYRLNTSTGWAQIPDFHMSTTAPRYWTIAVPVSETNYGRLATPVSDTVPNANGAKPVIKVNIGSTFQGTDPGLLVQDGVSQPQFIFLDINNNGALSCRTTKTYADWSFVIDATTLVVSTDEREYVPVGTFMEWYSGVLVIVSTDFKTIYRSVSGRPLDFVVNVDIDGQKGGDATTTAYSVGTGSITCLKAVSGSLFVSADNNACFAVTFDLSNQAPMLFGEYTFVRTFLFSATCLSDRGLVDVIGDTTFIDIYGLRSFNAIEQQENEGRNSVFSKEISSLLTGITQDPLLSAATLFDNYAIYSVKTIYGYALIIYDTLSNVYVSVDTAQFDSTSAITQFAVINTSVAELYAITNDNKLIQLFVGPSFVDKSTVRLMSSCSQDPSTEVKQNMVRCVLAQFSEDSTVSLTTFTNNRLSAPTQTKNIAFTNAVPPYTGTPTFTDVDTQVNNLLFSQPNNNQGWKVFNVFSWSGGGRITHIESVGEDLSPMNPLLSQTVS